MNAIINKALTCMCTFGQFNQERCFVSDGKLCYTKLYSSFQSTFRAWYVNFVSL